MSSTQIESSELSRPWQSKASTQLLAVAIGVLPLYLGSILYQLRSDRPFSNQGFIFYLAVISLLAIVIALLLLRFLCGENYRDLNLKPGRLSSDLLAALILTSLILVVNVVSQYFLSDLLPVSVYNTSVKNLFVEMAGNPGSLVIFVGPLIFLGAASEELIRVFLLSRLWNNLRQVGRRGHSACLFGLIHVYRGPVHFVSAAIFGLIMALYYLRFGRVFPFILAHYFTNALQAIVVAVLV